MICLGTAAGVTRFASLLHANACSGMSSSSETWWLFVTLPAACHTTSILCCLRLQDVNPVTYQLLMSQKCTIMFVGDRRQHIYGFDDAMDALSAAAAEPNRHKKAFTLSHSFRLGDSVAEVANRCVCDHKQVSAGSTGW